jgi:hypothetical protein
MIPDYGPAVELITWGGPVPRLGPGEDRAPKLRETIFVPDHGNMSTYFSMTKIIAVKAIIARK